MITSSEIMEKTFKTGHGYDRKEVDAFLKNVALEINELNLVIKNLEAKYNSINDTVAYYKNLENTIQKTLVMAQKTADSTIDSARKKACAIEEIAKAEAIKTITKASNEYSEVRSKTIELIHQYENYRAQFKRLAMVQFDLINDKSFDISIANLKADADKLSIDIDFDKLYNEYKTDYNDRIYTEEYKQKDISMPVEEPASPQIDIPAAEPVINSTETEVPVSEATDVIAPETTIAEIPVTKAPVVEVPVAEVPVTKAPVVETPVAEVPVVEAPVFEAPAFEDPIFVSKEMVEVVENTPIEEEATPTESVEEPKNEPTIDSEEFNEIDNAFTNMLDQVLKLEKDSDSDDISNETTEDTLFKRRSKKKIDKVKSPESDLNIGKTLNNEEDENLFSLDEDNFTIDSNINNKDDEFIFDESDDDGIGITFDFLDK